MRDAWLAALAVKSLRYAAAADPVTASIGAAEALFPLLARDEAALAAASGTHRSYVYTPAGVVRVPPSQTVTISMRSSKPRMSSVLRVYRAAEWACAVAAMSKSITRRRGWRPWLTVLAASRP